MVVWNIAASFSTCCGNACVHDCGDRCYNNDYDHSSDADSNGISTNNDDMIDDDLGKNGYIMNKSWQYHANKNTTNSN